MLRLFDTMSKKKRVFRPLGKTVKMYNCGLTVYNFAHIGNLRAYTFADLLRRYLEFKGYRVKQVMNFTDVGHMTEDEVISSDVGEDKMEVAAKRERKTVWDIAEFYIKAFLEDSKKMNFLEPHVRPRATQHIPEMIRIIKGLVKKGYAYVTPSGVYYDVSRFKRYGRLSGNTVEKLKAGAGGRVGFNPDKRNQFDFALWIVDPNHIMKWESPWGTGYPGWHIECSAMSMKYLGKTIDIHTGAVDNIFPHHECEIAQSEAYTGKKFVRYWMHCRHLMVDGQKMAKSSGKFYTLRDLEEKGFSPLALRFFLLSAHYRSELNFTLEALKTAEKTVKNLFDFTFKAFSLRPKGRYSREFSSFLKRARAEFIRHMDDDLDTPKALASVFDVVNETNRLMELGKLSRRNLREVFRFMVDIDRVLGLGLGRVAEGVPKSVERLVEKREKLRKAGKFDEADRIRKDLAERGYEIEDTPDGPVVKRNWLK